MTRHDDFEAEGREQRFYRREVFEPGNHAGDAMRAAERERQRKAKQIADPELERFRNIWPSIGREVSYPLPPPPVREYDPYGR